MIVLSQAEAQQQIILPPKQIDYIKKIIEISQSHLAKKIEKDYVAEMAMILASNQTTPAAIPVPVEQQKSILR